MDDETMPLGGLPATQEGVALAPDLINGVDPARLTLSAKDVNVGVDPMVTANAYTNSVAGATSTQQFVLDHGTNTLATLANNDGTLATVGEVTVDGSTLDFEANAGFDIVTDDAGTNTAYALLTADGDTRLYTLDLETGAATSIGMVPADAGMVSGLAVSGSVAYALADDGMTLISFDVSDPSTVTSTALSAPLNAIDFRPATGELYGYDDGTDAYFTVDLESGELTAASVPGAMTDTGMLDMDWNPTIDRLRVVTETDQNIVYNPEAGNASDAATTPLFFDEGDVNDGVDPTVTANAYTNSVADATSTQQFVLDHGTNTLATLANNAGTLATVGTVMLDGVELDFDANAGFDITSDGAGMDTAYALLASGGDTSLYTLDLETGAATSLGSIGDEFGLVNGLAVSGTTAYALGNDGSTLLSFDVSDPGTVMSTDLGGNLDAIDFRPATGELYGYDDGTDAYFTVDTMSGELAAASVPGAMTDTGMLDMDWNPTIDRLRVVTESDQNIVFNPEAGNASDAATNPLFYDAGNATVTFQSEIADFKNDLGVYLIGEDGTIGDGAIAFRSITQGDGMDGTLMPGATVDLDALFSTEQLAGAESLGFILFQNGSRESGGDSFTVREADGGRANLDTAPGDLILSGEDGQLIATKGDVFNSFDRLNMGGETRVISGVDEDTGNLLVGFEDLVDGDFNDLTIAVDNGMDQRMTAEPTMDDDMMTTSDDMMLV